MLPLVTMTIKPIPSADRMRTRTKPKPSLCYDSEEFYELNQMYDSRYAYGTSGEETYDEPDDNHLFTDDEDTYLCPTPKISNAEPLLAPSSQPSTLESPSDQDQDQDQAHRDYVQKHEDFYELCASETITVLMAFLSKHQGTIDLRFRNCQAPRALMKRCDPDIREFIRNRMGKDWQQFYYALVDAIEQFEPHVIAFIIDTLSKSKIVTGQVSYNLANRLKKIIRDSRDVPLAKKAFESGFLGNSFSSLDHNLAYFAESFDDALTDYVINLIEDSYSKGRRYQLSEAPESARREYNAGDLWFIAQTCNTRVFRQVLERWSVNLSTLRDDQLASFTKFCTNDKSGAILDTVIRAKLFNSLPIDRIHTDIIKAVAESGHTEAVAYLVSIAGLDRKQVVELLTVDFTTKMARTIIDNVRTDSTMLTDEELSSLSRTVRLDLADHLRSKANELLNLSMRYMSIDQHEHKPGHDIRGVSSAEGAIQKDKAAVDYKRCMYKGRGQQLF